MAKVTLTIEEAIWMQQAVTRTLKILKVEQSETKKVLTLESIAAKVQMLPINSWMEMEDEQEAEMDIELHGRQAKLLRQMAEASARALAERIIPEYRKRIEDEPEKRATLEPYIIKANARVSSLKRVIEKFGRAE